MEDAFASAHEFSRAVADALEEASSSSEGDGDGVALARAVWERLDVYFITRGGGLGVGTDAVVDWYRVNASSLALGEASASGRLRELVARLKESARPEEASGYWEMIVTMVAIGWTEAANDLLQMHSAWAE